ncbi:MFS transporter [Fulvivirga sediminis]|uniref:MFS transporter n=1 Tax=Fulvivirga sediminis TaxID=2803949 RepID=A0A937K0M5_9BACT|nr:MFS transporter [Fulvivirga sediminis]MBL3656501.1 MFS transporter [Fulvivirga sediminis]
MSIKEAKQSKTYTLQFWLLCSSSFLFFASFNMIIPELPDYLTSLGGEDYKGYIIAVFTLTAMISRPFSGKLADTVGRVPVMVIGALVCCVMGLVYPLVTTIIGFFILRFFHGFSTGFKPTGTVAYVADIVPDNRRGEALGLSSLFGTLGMSAGPAMGSQLKICFSLDVMFYTSSALALLSILILAGMKETLQNKQKFKWSHLTIRSNEIYHPKAIAPAIVLGLTIFSFGTVLTVVPDFTSYLGIENKGVYFTVFTLSSLLIRIFAGKASDKYGRVVVLKTACVLYALSMVITGFATDEVTLLAGAAVFGLGTGMNSPTIYAWVADRCDFRTRGRGMATAFIALELGIMLGSILSGEIYDNNPDNFKLVFLCAALLSIVGFFHLLVNKRK